MNFSTPSEVQFQSHSDSLMVIAGPCSADEEQLYHTTKGLKDTGIEIIRAGVWDLMLLFSRFKDSSVKI